MRKQTVLTSLLVTAVLFLQFFPAVQTVSAVGCDAAQFIADVTVPDGSAYSPNAAFLKTWRLKNVGTCSWSTGYQLAFVSGDQMSGPATVNLASSVAPGATVDVSVNLIAPVPAGTYRGFWELKNASGTLFGLGTTADKPFWVAIVTRPGSAVTPVPVGAAYDFASSGGSAQSWMSGAGILPFPGTDGDPRGFALKLDSAQLETGATVNQPTLLMVPQNKTDGYIQGLYPSLAIQSGDHFQATVGCQFGATSCFVTYRIDYRINTGTFTLWTWKEKYDGLSFNVDKDLSFLAGKNVEFFLLILASGSPAGDRALWVAPRIVHTGGGTLPTNTPAPTVTGTPPTPTATSSGPTNTPVPASGCDRATFISDVTVPDGTTFGPNQAFSKTWAIKNTGTCTWTTAYKLVFVSGDQMSGPAEQNFTSTVGPNTTVNLTVNLVSPGANGHYRGFWQLKNSSGALFGIGSGANMPFWVDIMVSGGGVVTSTATMTGTPATPTPTSSVPSSTPIPSGQGFDFASNGGSASWMSGAGTLPFPGTDGDTRGFALKLDTAKLETGVTVNQPTLLMAPQNKTDGYIQGLYASMPIQSGDHFQATVGCQFGATSCFVTYRIDYRINTGTFTLWTWQEKYDGLSFNLDKDLSFLAGKNVQFFLLILASGSPTGDRALWVAPRIVHTGGGSTATNTPAPIASATPFNGNWLLYNNTKDQFQFQYPPQGQLSNVTDTTAHIALPITPGTNLGEKYLDVTIAENATSCSSPLTSGYAPGSFTSLQVTINGITFTNESGADAGAGQIHQWTAYSTMKGSTCISMGFVLHSVNPGMMATPLPVFDFNAESAVFGQIMSTFVETGP